MGDVIYILAHVGPFALAWYLLGTGFGWALAAVGVI